MRGMDLMRLVTIIISLGVVILTVLLLQRFAEYLGI